MVALGHCAAAEITASLRGSRLGQNISVNLQQVPLTGSQSSLQNDFYKCAHNPHGKFAQKHAKSCELPTRHTGSLCEQVERTFKNTYGIEQMDLSIEPSCEATNCRIYRNIS